MAEYTVPEGYRLQPEEEYYDTQVMLDDLRTLVLRLARALRKTNDDTDLVERAMDYLSRKGLMPSSLRRAEVLNRAVNRSWERFKAQLECEADTQLLNWLEHACGEFIFSRIADLPATTSHFEITDTGERSDDDTVRASTLRDAINAAMKRWPAKEERDV